MILSQNEFVALWNGCSSIPEVVKKTGWSFEEVNKRAKKLRDNGVFLKIFGGGNPPKRNYSEGQDVLKACRNQTPEFKKNCRMLWAHYKKGAPSNLIEFPLPHFVILWETAKSSEEFTSLFSQSSRAVYLYAIRLKQRHRIPLKTHLTIRNRGFSWDEVKEMALALLGVGSKGLVAEVDALVRAEVMDRSEALTYICDRELERMKLDRRERWKQSRKASQPVTVETNA